MVGIDKTYIKTYSQYKEVCDWCKDIVVTFDTYNYKNIKFKPSDFINEYTEDDFNQLPENGELVLWNTPCYIFVKTSNGIMRYDKYCKLKFTNFN